MTGYSTVKQMGTTAVGFDLKVTPERVGSGYSGTARLMQGAQRWAVSSARDSTGLDFGVCKRQKQLNVA